MTSICTTTTLSNIANTASFNAWQSGSTVILNSISPTSASGATPPSLGESSTLNELADQVFDTALCLNEKLTELSSTTNHIQKAQEEIIRLTKAIDDAKEHTEIAKSRVEYIRNPDEQTSFYESWFPINRPMYQASIPIFIGIIVFLGVLPCVILVSYMLQSRSPGQPPGIFSRLYSAIFSAGPATKVPGAPTSSFFTRIYNAFTNTTVPPVIPAPPRRLPF